MNLHSLINCFASVVDVRDTQTVQVLLFLFDRVTWVWIAKNANVLHVIAKLLKTWKKITLEWC